MNNYGLNSESYHKDRQSGDGINQALTICGKLELLTQSCIPSLTSQATVCFY